MAGNKEEEREKWAKMDKDRKHLRKVESKWNNKKRILWLRKIASEGGQSSRTLWNEINNRGKDRGLVAVKVGDTISTSKQDILATISKHFERLGGELGKEEGKVDQHKA